MGDVKNKWKMAFWVQAIIFLFVVAGFLYVVIDQSYTITYMKDGYEDTEHDWQQVMESVKGKLTKSDFTKILERYPDSAELREIYLNSIKISFDKNNMVDSITTFR